MRRLHLQLADEYADRADHIAASERRATGNWLAKIVMDAIDAVSKQDGSVTVDALAAAVRPPTDQKPKKCSHPIIRRIGSGCGECGAELGGKS